MDTIIHKAVSQIRRAKLQFKSPPISFKRNPQYLWLYKPAKVAHEMIKAMVASQAKTIPAMRAPLNPFPMLAKITPKIIMESH
jgi:hypothetical protein